MPLLVSGCGEYEANGCYYQEQNDPPKYLQSNRRHVIVQEMHIVSQGSGSCRQKVWVLRKLSPVNGAPCTLYLCPVIANHYQPPFAQKTEWKMVAGSQPLPQVQNCCMQQNNNGKNTKTAKLNGNGNHKIQCNDSSQHRIGHHYNNSSSPKKRTFAMFNNDHEEEEDHNLNAWKQTPHKRIKFDRNYMHVFHGNQFNQNANQQRNLFRL